MRIASFISMVSPPFEGKPCPPKVQLYNIILTFIFHAIKCSAYLLVRGKQKQDLLLLESVEWFLFYLVQLDAGGKVVFVF
jgi:hypothetical protein